ncbi:MAG: tripartite tricarboxylate transporter TctB family protein [Proteobacteria bacterium]|nr:tripartite tricarboxylate transporter TctB family protein [Pseudomonadota bacterium]
MRRPYQVTALLCLSLALFVGWNAVRLRYYTSLGPGPGFFPLWLAVLFGLLALAMLFHATWSVPEAMKPDFYPSRAGAMRVGTILALLLVAALAIEAVGFRLTMLAFNLGMMGVFGRRGWIETVLISVAGSFGAYYVFVDFLKIALPEGIF